MISRLVRTELGSYLHDLFPWGITVFSLLVLFLSFMGTVLTRSPDSESDGMSGIFLLSVGLSSVLLAVKVSGRNAVEKRTRLFSQLPVSTREVSFASWCVRLLWLSIPTLAFTVFVARAANMAFPRFLLVTLATYMAGTTLVALISVAMSLRHLPTPMSSWANGVYIGCAIVAVAIWFLGNLLVFPWPPIIAIGSLTGAGLPGLAGFLMVSAVGFVLLDVWLRDRADDYLG
jgi:hypothetical protein